MAKKSDPLTGAAWWTVKQVLIPANPFGGIATGLNEIWRTGRRTAGAVLRILGPERAPEGTDFLRDVQDPKQRFVAAMRFWKRRPEDLPAIERGLAVVLWTWAVAAILALAWSAVSLKNALTDDAGRPWMALTTLGCWALAALCVSRAASRSFELWQIKHRSLAPVRDWLSDPTHWLDGGGTAALSAILAAVFGWTAFGGKAALAQQAVNSGNVFQQMATATQTGDLSFQWMQRLFPGSIEFWLINATTSVGGVAATTPNGASTATDVLQPLFQVFNSVLFALAAGMMCWHTVQGIVFTAHSGRAMGEKYHTIWAPMRIVWGIGNLAPVKGYCMAQILIINVLLGGYSLANLEWSTYVSSMLGINGQTQTTLVPPPFDASQTLLPQAVKAETCLAVVQAIASQDPGFMARHFSWLWNNRPNVSVPQAGGASINGGAAYVWDYGPICGSFKLTQTASQAATTISTGEGTTTTIVDPQEQAAYQAFDNTRVQALDKLLNDIRSSGLPKLAASSTALIITNSGGPNIPAADAARTATAQAMTAISTYNNTISQAAATLSNSLDSAGRQKFYATATNMGWASAGALNFTLARLSAMTIERVGAAAPTAQPVDIFKLAKDPDNEDVKKLKAALDLATHALRDRSDDDYVANSDVQVREDTKSDNPLWFVGKFLTDRMAKGAVNWVQVDDVIPMRSLMTEGTWSLVAGEGIYGAWVTATSLAYGAEDEATLLGSKQVAAAPGIVYKAGELVGPFIHTITGALLVFGVVNAYVLPLAPYMLWVFAVLSCAAFAFEAVVAAPLAAFQHVRMDGDSFIGHEQRAIYGIAFNAFMRPSLLLFGLVASNQIFAVMITYVNHTFASAMLSSQGDSIIGIAGILSMMAMEMFLHYQIAIRSFRLITDAPRMVSHMIGVQDSGDRGEHDSHTAVFGAVTNFSKNAATGLAARGMLGPKEEEDGGDGKSGGGKSGGKGKGSITKEPQPATGTSSGGNVVKSPGRKVQD